MYGYFRPREAGLTQDEFRLFSAYYCRLCYCLRSLGGQIARYFTTYDAVVYALIINLQKGEEHPPYLKCQKIAKSNMRKFENDETGLKLARLSIIAFGEKIRDDVVDDNSALSKLANKIFAKLIKEAREKEPEMAQNGYEGTKLINKLQKDNAPLFQVLSAYEDMAVKAFSLFGDLSDKTEELIRSVSAWIFFVDMVCDYAEDYKSGAYNGLKTQGLETFEQYFNVKYNQFLGYEKAITDRLVAALLNVNDGSLAYSLLFKVIINAVNTVIPAAIMGGDIKFHYFRNLIHNYSDMYRHNAGAKRLGVEWNEKGRSNN